MKKLTKALISLLLVISISLPVCAATAQNTNTADALNSLGLFLGKGGKSGYALDDTLQRQDGITLIVRLLGKETEAQSGKYIHPFTDVPQWADGYAAYAYQNGITKGISESLFGSVNNVTQAQFLTMVLRVLGYSDSGSEPDFKWDSPFLLAKATSLIASSAEKPTFTRADAIEIFWNALNAKLKNQKITLYDRLLSEKVFTADAFAEAAKIRAEGKKQSAGKPAETIEKPETYSWEQFLALTSEQKDAFLKSFPSPDDFIVWMNEEQAKYAAEHPEIEIDPNVPIYIG